MGTDLKLIGSRVVLRPMTIDDADDVVRWRNDTSVAQQMFAPPPRSREVHLQWFKKIAGNDDRQEFIIERSLEDGERQSVGTIGLSDIIHIHRHAEYGILIGEANARGAGVAFEASRLLLAYAFETLSLNRVYLRVFDNNDSALRLYERIGFRREGVLRRHARQGDVFRDVVVMGLLREEWPGTVSNNLRS